MFCLNCGEAIPDGSRVCPKCGANFVEEQSQETVIYASQKTEEAVPPPTTEKKPFTKKLVCILGAVALIFVIVLIVTGVQKSNLQKDLQKEWMDTDGTILRVLEFDDGKVEYRLETGYAWMDTTLFKGKYKVVSGKKVKIDSFGSGYQTYTVKFNDEKSVMTIMPAVTSADSSEKWYNLH